MLTIITQTNKKSPFHCHRGIKIKLIHPYSHPSSIRQMQPLVWILAMPYTKNLRLDHTHYRVPLRALKYHSLQLGIIQEPLIISI